MARTSKRPLTKEEPMRLSPAELARRARAVGAVRATKRTAEAIAQCTSDDPLRKLDLAVWTPIAADYDYLREWLGAEPSTTVIEAFELGYHERCLKEAARLDGAQD